MTQQERSELKDIINDRIRETKEEIEHLKELTKPVAPDNAIGRLSRMDAINIKPSTMLLCVRIKRSCKNWIGPCRILEKRSSAAVPNAGRRSLSAGSSSCHGPQNA